MACFVCRCEHTLRKQGGPQQPGKAWLFNTWQLLTAECLQREGRREISWGQLSLGFSINRAKWRESDNKGEADYWDSDCSVIMSNTNLCNKLFSSSKQGALGLPINSESPLQVFLFNPCFIYSIHLNKPWQRPFMNVHMGYYLKGDVISLNLI